MSWSWRIGRIAGIDVYLHFTFLILIAWVALTHYFAHFSVTCARGGGGHWSGWRTIWPEQEGQLNAEFVLSFAIRCSACAGLNVAGRGFRMATPMLRYDRIRCGRDGTGWPTIEDARGVTT